MFEAWSANHCILKELLAEANKQERAVARRQETAARLLCQGWFAAYDGVCDQQLGPFLVSRSLLSPPVKGRFESRYTRFVYEAGKVSGMEDVASAEMMKHLKQGA